MISFRTYVFLILLFLFAGCKKEQPESVEKNLSIFFFNDQHGQIENFSKVKEIIDKERLQTNVIVACGGDAFSGNPVVDNYPEKGYPMIDIMNGIGVDIAVIGNHEFDYGFNTLADRIEQSNFDWVCANVDMENTGIPQPLEFKTLNIEELRITFLGLIETSGKPDAIIPATHPFKVQGITFERPEDVVSRYSDIKEQENSDLYIALTHIGHAGYYGTFGDFQLAKNFPYFDLIIGAHSSYLIDTIVNSIPIFQAGRDLEYLGKIKIKIIDKQIDEITSQLIDLNTYPDQDPDIQAEITEYNDFMAEILDEVIGFSQSYHDTYQLGCFYTEALKGRLEVDIAFQNYGGIRSDLDAGDITVKEIYSIDPFNNGALIYNMSVSDIKNFFIGSQSWFCYSGIQIEQLGNTIQISDLEGNIMPDTTTLSLGINDYIPAVHDSYFPANGELQDYTTAEAIIYYLKNINSVVDYPACNNFFRYQ